MDLRLIGKSLDRENGIADIGLGTGIFDREVDIEVGSFLGF